MEQRVVRIMYILIAIALANEMSTVQTSGNNKRRTKDKTGGFQKNICDITDRDSKVHCYCENTRELKNATKAECWVFNGGITPEDYIWLRFASQPTLQTLSFNVRVDGALGFVPTKALQYLQSLRVINIKYGNIIDVTTFDFANLTNLREVTLSQNQIKTLQQYAFTHLPNLTMINLADNMIAEIPKEVFFDLPMLQKFTFTKNNISNIKDGAFQHTFNLLELDLNENNIQLINRRTFDGLANLRKLDLRKNHIYNLTKFTFAELWNLQELLLGSNYLKFISERAFDGLSQLKKLSLDDNKLAALPSGLFEGVRGLSSLDLRSNQLHALTFDNIKPILDNLKPPNSNLHVEENNFVCDCRLKWMHSLRNETKSQSTKASLESVTCELDPPFVSSANNDISKDGKLEFNKDILHVGITIETADNNDIPDKRMTSEDLSKELVNDIIAPLSKRGINRTILKMPPESLPCPVINKTATEFIPFMVDPAIPIQNEMKTFRFHEINSGSRASVSVCVAWSAGFVFYSTYNVFKSFILFSL